MSDSMLAVLLTIAMLVLMVVWVPFLEVVCPPCSRVLQRWKLRSSTEENVGAEDADEAGSRRAA